MPRYLLEQAVSNSLDHAAIVVRADMILYHKGCHCCIATAVIAGVAMQEDHICKNMWHTIPNPILEALPQDAICE